MDDEELENGFDLRRGKKSVALVAWKDHPALVQLHAHLTVELSLEENAMAKALAPESKSGVPGMKEETYVADTAKLNTILVRALVEEPLDTRVAPKDKTHGLALHHELMAEAKARKLKFSKASTNEQLKKMIAGDERKKESMAKRQRLVEVVKRGPGRPKKA